MTNFLHIVAVPYFLRQKRGTNTFNIDLARKKILCCKLNSVVSQSRLVLFEIQDSLVLFLVFHRYFNLARNKILILTNQCVKFCSTINVGFCCCVVGRSREMKNEKTRCSNRNNVARQAEGFYFS